MIRAAHTAHHLKPRQFQILGLLHDHGGLAQRELMREMNVDPSILVTLLNPLEADALVSRERDPADRRRHRVTLTPAGKRALVSASRAQKETEDALFASLDDEQREQLGALLISLRDGLAADTESACSAAAEPEPEAAGQGSTSSAPEVESRPRAAPELRGMI